MNFNFGNSGSGFSFGVQKTTAGTAPPAGFAMASTSTAGGGFSFGTPNQSQAPSTAATPQTTSLFSSTAQSNTGPTGGFSFGSSVPGSTGGGGGGGFTFGTSNSKPNLGAPAATQPATTGLTLGAAATSAGSGFPLGGGSTQTTAAPAGGGFSFGTGIPGAPAAQTSAAQPSTGFTFGVLKAQVQPIPSTTTAPAAAGGGGFSFGTTTTAAPAQATPPLTLGAQSSGLTLGSVITNPVITTTSGTAAQTGFSFGVKTSATPAPAATAPAGQPVPAASLFTASTAATSTVTAAAVAFTPAVPATTSAAAGTLGLAMKPLGAAATSTVTAAPPASGAASTFSLGLKPATTAATGTTASITGTATSTTAAAASMPPVMSYAQLETLINKWSLELEDQERHFLQQATQVNAWDRMLLENGEKITSLHREMEKVKLDQRRLDQELDFILSQQKELEDLLSPLEEVVKEQSGTIYMQNADEERERTYKLAENVDAQLKRMSQDLKDIIEHLNTSSGPADTSDPLQQICKILNAHMDSLQWIDQNSVLLQRRVEEVSKLCDNRRKEQEKNFRITFE
ncbi:hypothetical protein GJAV_G00130510 [Gymnothorax javanicus]|nr:hypothetical protein GJAV_G00130510 [Gymnothorax javanicus]